MACRLILSSASALTEADRIEILKMVSTAARERYVLPSMTPNGDLSVDLDRVRADLPHVFERIVKIVEARIAVLNTVASP
jgi:hypothetical protein